MTVATQPWWVIGSAAVALHGAATSVADIDLLLDIDDAAAVFEAMGVPALPGRPDGRFRSDVFGRCTATPLAIELMAGLHLRRNDGWVPVALETRVARHGVFVPARAELAALLRRFGRDKDLGRAAALDVSSSPTRSPPAARAGNRAR